MVAGASVTGGRCQWLGEVTSELGIEGIVTTDKGVISQQAIPPDPNGGARAPLQNTIPGLSDPDV